MSGKLDLIISEVNKIFTPLLGKLKRIFKMYKEILGKDSSFEESSEYSDDSIDEDEIDKIKQADFEKYKGEMWSELFDAHTELRNLLKIDEDNEYIDKRHKTFFSYILFEFPTLTCNYENNYLTMGMDENYKWLKNGIKSLIKKYLEKRGTLEVRIYDIEKLELNISKVKSFIEKNARLPSVLTKSIKEKKLAEMMHRLNRPRIDDIRKKVKKELGLKSLEDKIDEYIFYTKKLGRKPSAKSSNVEERKFGNFYFNQKKRIKPISDDLQKKLKEMFELEFS